jgi:hypothetical protein
MTQRASSSGESSGLDKEYGGSNGHSPFTPDHPGEPIPMEHDEEQASHHHRHPLTSFNLRFDSTTEGDSGSQHSFNQPSGGFPLESAHEEMTRYHEYTERHYPTYPYSAMQEHFEDGSSHEPVMQHAYLSQPLSSRTDICNLTNPLYTYSSPTSLHSSTSTLDLPIGGPTFSSGNYTDEDPLGKLYPSHVDMLSAPLEWSSHNENYYKNFQTYHSHKHGHKEHSPVPFLTLRELALLKEHSEHMSTHVPVSKTCSSSNFSSSPSSLNNHEKCTSYTHPADITSIITSYPSTRSHHSHPQ